MTNHIIPIIIIIIVCRLCLIRQVSIANLDEEFEKKEWFGEDAPGEYVYERRRNAYILFYEREDYGVHKDDAGNTPRLESQQQQEGMIHFLHSITLLVR